MKKSIITKIVLFSIIGFFAFSCTSTKTFSINRARHEEPRLQQEIPLESFIILGNVSGQGVVNSFFVKKEEKFEGDTGLYGSLDWDDAIYLNLQKNAMVIPRTPFDAALGNAIYQMIEEAEALDADVILFVRTKIQVSQKKGLQEVTVTVKGVATKLKNTSSSKRSNFEDR